MTFKHLRGRKRRWEVPGSFGGILNRLEKPLQGDNKENIITAVKRGDEDLVRRLLEENPGKY